MLISKYGNGSEELVREFENKLYLPIGVDSFGNYFAIGLSEDSKGKIVFCNHEKGFSLNQIADSFAHFINKCKSGEINPRARRTPEEREADLTARGKAGNITDGLRDIWKQEYEKYKDMIQEEVVLTK